MRRVSLLLCTEIVTPRAMRFFLLSLSAKKPNISRSCSMSERGSFQRICGSAGDGLSTGVHVHPVGGLWLGQRRNPRCNRSTRFL